MTGKDLLGQLPVLDENILAEAVRQPLLFVEAARYRVQKMRKRALAGAKLEAERARIALKIRNKKNAQGDKMTEGALKERLETSPLIQNLRRASDAAYEEEEWAKLILEAYRQRNSAIKVVAEAETYEGHREGAVIERGEQHRKLVASARRLRERQGRVFKRGVA